MNLEVLEQPTSEAKDSQGFVGRHLLLDARTSSPRGINEPAVIYAMLESLSKTLDMTLVYPPLVARFPFAANELSRFVATLKAEGLEGKTIATMEQLLARRHEEDAGISGVTVWLESHAAIHTWTEENFFSFDAYSCKDFDPDKALDMVLQFFDVESYNGLDIIRTIDAPQYVRVLEQTGDPKARSVRREGTNALGVA